MIKNKDFEYILKDIKPTFDDLIKNIITKGDSRYWDYYEIDWAIVFLIKKCIKIRVIKIPNYKIDSKIFLEKYPETKKIRGYFSTNATIFFLKKGYKIKAVEYWYTDMIMKGFKKELQIEFGQCRISKLWEYLEYNKCFVIVPNDNYIIIIKRDKNFKKGIQYREKYILNNMLEKMNKAVSVN